MQRFARPEDAKAPVDEDGNVNNMEEENEDEPGLRWGEILCSFMVMSIPLDTSMQAYKSSTTNMSLCALPHTCSLIHS